MRANVTLSRSFPKSEVVASWYGEELYSLTAATSNGGRVSPWLILIYDRSDYAVAASDPVKRWNFERLTHIVLGTTSPDYITPDTSVVLQYKLGAKNAGTFDVGCACASFPPLIAIGSGLIATNPAIKTILVIGVDDS
jgi:hypothetical protein